MTTHGEPATEGPVVVLEPGLIVPEFGETAAGSMAEVEEPGPDDLYERVRPVDQPYFQESRGKRLGTTDFASFQAKAREKGVATFRTVLEPARRVLKEQPFLSGDQPAYPDYALAGAFLWARIASPLSLIEADDPINPWRERMLDLFDGMGRKAKTA